MEKTKIFRTFIENLPTIFRKIIFREISPKSFSQGFLLISIFPKIVRKLTKTNFRNCPKTYRELIVHEFYQKHFPEFYNFPKFSEKLKTILVNVRFQFCLAAESIGQDGAIQPDDQPIKLQESRAG